MAPTLKKGKRQPPGASCSFRRESRPNHHWHSEARVAPPPAAPPKAVELLTRSATSAAHPRATRRWSSATTGDTQRQWRRATDDRRPPLLHYQTSGRLVVASRDHRPTSPAGTAASAAYSVSRSATSIVSAGACKVVDNGAAVAPGAIIVRLHQPPSTNDLAGCLIMP